MVLAPLVAAMVAIGFIFGLLQTAVSAYSRVLLLAMSLMAFGEMPLWLGMALTGASVAITSALLDSRLPGRSVDVEHPRLVVQEFSTNAPTAK